MTSAGGKGKVEVSVHGIGAGGFGVGTLPDGKVVFLPRTAPGDRVVAKIVKEKARWARGEAEEWLEEGPGRRKAPCPRFSVCDGCSLQHLIYSEQLAWKARLVGDALRRLGGLELEDPEVVPSPKETHYRNKVTFTLRRLPGQRVVAGFRELGHRGRVVDIGPECLLPEEPLLAVWREIRGNWGVNAALLPQGRELRLTLRGGEAGIGLWIRGGRGDGDPNGLLSRISGLSSVWREDKTGRPRHLAGEVSLPLVWSQEVLELGGGGFVQVNRSAGELLFDYVFREMGDVSGLKVIDAYCGLGTLGRAAANRGGEVVGIDIIPHEQDGAHGESSVGFEFVQGLVETELSRFLPAGLVILNPPRTGLEDSIPVTLKADAVDRLVYVSCNPATLARDLQRLEEGYQVERVRSFDLFPQTGHVETVVSLRKRSA